MKITLKTDFTIHNIAGEKVLINVEQRGDFSKMLMLNDTAAWVIAELQKQPATPEKLIQRLTEIYDVSLKEAQADIKKLLWHLEEQGIVIIEE